MGARHDGRGSLGHKGPGGDDAGNRALARLAGLRGAGGDVLARVRAARQRDDHRAPAPRSSGRTVRVRRAGRPEHRRRPGPAGGGDGSPRPAWEPGTRQAYHGLTLGFYEGELLRRVDPAAPHPRPVLPGRNRHAAWRGLLHPAARRRFRTLAWPRSRLQDASRCCRVPPLRLMVEGINPRSNIYRALVVNPGHVGLPRRAARLRAQSRSAGGRRRRHGARRWRTLTASSPRTDANSACDSETLDLLAAPAIPPAHGFYDECLKGEVQFSLGFMKPCGTGASAAPRSFGSPGAGGALGFADPDAGVGYGYVTSQMGTTFIGDPRDVAMTFRCSAFMKAAPRPVPSVRGPRRGLFGSVLAGSPDASWCIDAGVIARGGLPADSRMASAPGSAMAIAVSNAGGLGSLPCAMLTPDGLRDELAASRPPHQPLQRQFLLPHATDTRRGSRGQMA